jgi:hypothetical protein
MSVLDTRCWACSLPPMFTHGAGPVPLCSICRAYIANPLAGVRIATVGPKHSASSPVAPMVSAPRNPPPGLDAPVPASAQNPTPAAPVPGGDADLSIEAARAERDRASGCMCAAELLVRSDVDRRCPLHGGINTSPRAPQLAATERR